MSEKDKVPKGLRTTDINTVTRNKRPLGNKISETSTHFAKRDFRKRVHVDSDGYFQIPIPTFARDVLGFDRVGGNTKDEAEREFKHAEEQYIETTTDRQKVIVYEVNINAVVWDEDQQRVTFREKEIHFADGTGICLDYGVMYRHIRKDLDGDSAITYHKKDGAYVMSHSYTHDVKWMPWSAEAEEFFRQCEKQLEKLAVNIWTFLHQEPEQIESKIQEAMNLLPYREVESPEEGY